MKLTDHAGGRPGAAATKAAGYGGSVRYLANSSERGLPNKILTPEEAADYKANGLVLVSNWQKGKNATADWRRGKAGGVEDASRALDWHFRCGGSPYTPIYFSIDEDVSLAQWNSLCAPYLSGAGDVLGKQWVGAYGGLNTMNWAIEDDLVGHSTTPGFRWLWQTKAWSTRGGVRTWHPATAMRQELVCPPDSASVAGITVDVNFTYADDFGQWDYSRNVDVEDENSPEWHAVLGQFKGAVFR